MGLAQPAIAWKPVQYRWQAPSARLRAYLPCQYLQNAGFNCEIFDVKNSSKYQLVIFQKAYTQEDIELANRLKASGTKIVFDLCDNHFYNPDNLPIFAERKERLYRILEIADGVTVSTSELQKVLTEEGKESVIIDDVVHQWWNRNLWESIAGYTQNLLPKLNQYLRIVWYGSSGLESPPFGMVDLEKLIPILENLNQQIPIKLSVISDSKNKFDKYLSHVNFKTQYFNWELNSFPRIFKKHDICIIPINLNSFTVCKSNNRLILALLLGVSVIADKIPSYEDLGDFVLFGEWEDSLYTYATQPEIRHQKIIQGINYINSKYNQERVINQWSSLIRTFA
jgi:hypothetical protein